MNVKSVKELEVNRYELEIEVEAEVFENAVNKAYNKNKNKISVPGFRKGKATRSMIEKLYGEDIFHEDAINEVYPPSLEQALKESDLELVDKNVDLDIITASKEGFLFKAVVTVKPEVEVGEYKNLTAKKKIVSVSDEEIDEEVKKLTERNARIVSVEDRPAQNEDNVIFDFEGSVDGIAFEGGKAENYSLTLGSGQFIPGFEDQIVGHNIGDEFDVNVTFPEDYNSEELKGKEAVFKCKLHEIKFRELPEIDDELAKDVSEFDTLNELKDDLKSKLIHKKEHEIEHDIENQLIDQIIDGIKAEIPQIMYENRIDEDVKEFDYRLRQQGMDIKTYLQYTNMEMDSFRKTFREQAEKQVKIRLALEKIAEIEKLAITNEEIEEEYKKIAESYKTDVEKIKGLIDEDMITKDLSVGKAVEIVKESANIEEVE